MPGKRKKSRPTQQSSVVVPTNEQTNKDESNGEDVVIEQELTGKSSDGDSWEVINTKVLSNPRDTGFFKLETLDTGYEIVNGQLIIKSDPAPVSKAAETKDINDGTTNDDSAAPEGASQSKKNKKKSKSKKTAEQNNLTATNDSKPQNSESELEPDANDNDDVAVLEALTSMNDDDTPWSLVPTKALPNPTDTGFFRLDVLPGDMYKIENGQLEISSGVTKSKQTKSKKSKPETVKALKGKSANENQESTSGLKETVPETDIVSTEPASGTSNPRDGTEDWQMYDFHDDILRGIKALGFASPTPIQKLAFPAIIRKGRDVLACAETGSGKTLAFGLPILNSLRNEFPEKGSPLSALILTPTRELAMQVADHLRQAMSGWSKDVTARIATLVGGMAMPKQVRVLNQCPEIVVATPGRLNALMEEEEHPHLAHLDTALRFLAIDEADRMLDKGHFPDLQPLVAKLTSAKSKKHEANDEVAPEFKTWKRQTLLFSATLLTNQGDQRKKQNGNLRPTAKSQKKRRKMSKKEQSPIIQLMEQIGLRGTPEICFVEKPRDESENEQADSENKSRRLLLPEGLRLCQIDCPEQDKDVFLYYLLSLYHGRTLVFVNTIASLKRLATVLQTLQVPNLVTLHANMKQKQRIRHLERFRAAPNGVMIASDVAARGLDIAGVDHVVHHGVPTNVEVFLHRSGRTARAKTKGLSLALVAPSDLKTFLMCCKSIHSIHGSEAEDRGITPQGLDNFNVERTHMGLIRERVRVAKQLYKITSKLNNRRMDHEWMVKNAEANEMELDETLGGLDKEDLEELNAKEKRQANRLRGELKALLRERLVTGARGHAYGSGFVTASHELVNGGVVDSVQVSAAGILDPKRLLEIAQMSSESQHLRPKGDRKRKATADPHQEQLEKELQKRIKRKAKRSNKGLRM